MRRSGPLNLITDVPGLRVGSAEDHPGMTGVTVLVPDAPATASVAVLGGSPGTRETDLLSPEQTVPTVDALVLAGGSAYGLEAAAGVTAGLVARGSGFKVGGALVPIVPAAILFDLTLGDKPWSLPGADGPAPPHRGLGRAAFEAALASADRRFTLGAAGAGLGATAARGRGGLGSASTVLSDGTIVGALVAVNALGSVTIGDSDHYWAAPFEIGDEFGGRGWPAAMPRDAVDLVTKRGGLPVANTTIAIVATDATLGKAEAKRMASAAHDGIAHAVWPAHTPFDGDLVFGLSTGRRPLGEDAMMELCAAAAATLARAIARGVHIARTRGTEP